MSSLGQVHDNKGDSCCKTGCEPLKSGKWVFGKVELEDSCNDDTDQTAEEVTEDERTRLCEWYIDCSIAENC